MNIIGFIDLFCGLFILSILTDWMIEKSIENGRGGMELISCLQELKSLKGSFNETGQLFAWIIMFTVYLLGSISLIYLYLRSQTLN